MAGIPSFTVNGIAVTRTAAIQTGNWGHLAGTYDGTTARLFVNGALVKEVATAQVLQPSDFPLMIGRASYPNEERPFFGKIDEVRVWNVARSESQIQGYRNTRLEGVEAGLVGYWAWDQGTAGDGSLAGNHGSLKGSAAIVADDSLVLATPIFQRVVSSVVSTNIGLLSSVAWGDYNHDGFLDLAVGSWDGPVRLYRNNGNSNHWLRVRCVGTHSNRSGIGAQVRVVTTEGGTERKQLRQISGDGGHGGQPNLEAHFGLGAATTAKSLQIRWPSGRMQEFKDVRADQSLTIAEPPFLAVSQPQPGGGFEIVLESLGGFDYLIEYSHDLVAWRLLETVTTSEMASPSRPTSSTGWSRWCRSMRAVRQPAGNPDRWARTSPGIRSGPSAKRAAAGKCPP